MELKRKSFDLLITLLGKKGEVVHKDHLLSTLWPDVIVEEANLTQNIYLLRKALGESAEHQIYIETVPKHGYRFITDVVEGWGDVLHKPTPDGVWTDADVSRSHKPTLSVRPPPDSVLPRRRRRHLVVALAIVFATAMLTALRAYVSERDERSRLASRNDVRSPTESEKQKLDKHHSQVRAAYEAYARGLYHWNMRTESALKLAIRHFEEATRLDPGYALAHAALADSYALVGFFRYGLVSCDETYQRAQAAALSALELDPTLAETQTVLAIIKYDYEGDLAGAEIKIKRALELNPNYAIAHHRYSVILLAQGRFSESYDEAREAHRLDPTSRAINVNLIVLLLQMRDYDKVEEHCAKAKEIEPDSPYLNVYCGIAAEQKGRVEEAFASYKAALGLASRGTEPYKLALQFYGLGCAATGRADEARRAAAELVPLAELADERLLGLAGIYARLGEMETALSYLDRFIRKAPGNVQHLQGDPRISMMEGDPRYTAMVKKYMSISER